MSEWRVVVKGERRPIGPVLVFSEGTSPEDRLVSAIHGGEPEASFEIVIARWQRGAWRDFKRGWIIHDVTHWLPLPAPPPAHPAPTLDALLSVATGDEADAIRACAERLSKR